MTDGHFVDSLHFCRASFYLRRVEVEMDPDQNREIRVAAQGQRMTTLAIERPTEGRGLNFFLASAVMMALVLVAGFSLQVAMGRSTFHSPVPVHLHALLFFGWTTLYVVQNALATTGSVAVHRRLGWLATVWIPAMVVVGTVVTVGMVRRGHAPFFFEPLYFLVMDELTLVAFAGLAFSSILLRRRTEWHRRLMFCGMALLTGPGFGRLLPMPLLIPYAGWAAFCAAMLFPVAGVIRDIRNSGKVHPAWFYGIAVMIGTELAMDGITNSAAGLVIYDVVTWGSPGAAIDPRAFPPFPKS
jgi:hypothetical protein